MAYIEVMDKGIIYENSLPQLRSRHAYFPNVVQLPDGKLIASYALCEAIESVDQTTYISVSEDGGRTWEQLGAILDKSTFDHPVSDTMKHTLLPDGRLLAVGYCFDRSNPELPIGNPETGGLLMSQAVCCESGDGGRSWSRPTIIPTSYLEPVEASAPLTVLAGGALVAPIANFFDWEGRCPSGLHGRLLRSDDGGNTWSDEAVTMEFPGRRTTVWEQRLCETKPGSILVIAWNENLDNGTRLHNHYSVSSDNGRTFSEPMPTGIMGQASCVISLGEEKVLSLHCMRRDTSRPGIYAYLVDTHQGKWQILHEYVVWEPMIPIQADKHVLEVFSYVKFGQPSAIRLNDGSYFMFFWSSDDGIGKIPWIRLSVSV